MSDQRPTARDSGRALLILIAVAVVLRCGMVWALSGNLTDDRDVYLSLARGLREGRGYSVPGTEQPTAFRPPMYPLMLSVATGVSEPVGVAVLNVLLGAGTVLVTHRLGLRLGLSQRFAWIAGAIVAVDPLLLVYTTFPMTETLCAFLAGALLLAVSSGRNPKQLSESKCSKRAVGNGLRAVPVRGGDAEGHSRNGTESVPYSTCSTSSGRWMRNAVVTGLLFGLCVLSRPTFWVFGGLMAIRYFAGLRLRRGADGLTRCKFAGVTLLGVILMVAAWPIRNFVALGSPILTTTHGGYTLLLGNNPAFYDEVVRQPWGTVWDGSRGPGQQVWVQSVNDEMEREVVNGEVASDRWMSARAWGNIRDQPGMFVRACLLRLVRFWNIVPSGPAADGLPEVVVWTVGGCYLLWFAAAAWGAAFVLRERRGDWMPVLLLVAAFTLVHLVYWSNARMRAPVMPAVAVLAVAGMAKRRCGGDGDR